MATEAGEITDEVVLRCAEAYERCYNTGWHSGSYNVAVKASIRACLTAFLTPPAVEPRFTLTEHDIGRHVRRKSSGAIGIVRKDAGNGWIHPSVVYEWGNYRDDLEFVTVTVDGAGGSNA